MTFIFENYTFIDVLTEGIRLLIDPMNSNWTYILHKLLDSKQIVSFLSNNVQSDTFIAEPNQICSYLWN